LDDAFGVTIPPNARILRNLIQGANLIQSHILHFYHLAALDYVKGPDTAPFVPRYEGDYRLPDDVNAVVVGHYLQALGMRRKAHELGAIFGAKMPHVTVFLPGGVTTQVTAERMATYEQQLRELISFIDDIYVPDVLAVAGAYEDWFTVGAGCRNLLSYGAYPLTDRKDPAGSNQFFDRGVYANGKFMPMDANQIKEYVSHSWYQKGPGKHPAEGETVPETDKRGAYSWIKAPRYEGQPLEVGPLARMWVGRNTSVTGLGDKAFSVMGRHFARAIETTVTAHAMLDWLQELVPGEPTFAAYDVPRQAKGVGLTEAPRGALGHWIEIEDHVIKNYQAVVPSTWNISPRDDNGIRGPLEEALIGTEVVDSDNPIELVRIVRSFDPCIACAVHVIEVRDRSKIASFTIS
jgi:hydrogenase large subunit